MKISKSVLNSILRKMPISPPEMGGIIAGKDGCICKWEFDKGMKVNGCVYCPNVEYLNQVIEEWLREDYEFMGILHTHFGGSEALSMGDKRYINEIMKAMPSTIRQLYFPLVVQPEGKLIPYIAIINNDNSVSILLEKLEVS